MTLLNLTAALAAGTLFAHARVFAHIGMMKSATASSFIGGLLAGALALEFWSH